MKNLSSINLKLVRSLQKYM